MNKKVLYLASYKAKLDYENVIYQDKFIKRDISGCMLETNLDEYDVIIATPPCNYYSRANWRREVSEYSQETKHLLPEILKKLVKLNKPFLVENVINQKLMKDFIDLAPHYKIGRHTYWTNLKNFNVKEIEQIEEPKIQYTPQSKRQGGMNVKLVCEYFIDKAIKENKWNTGQQQKKN